MQRIINFRPFLLTAIFAISAIICGVLFATVNNVLGIVIACVLFVTALALCIIYRKNTVKLITFILCGLITVGCFFYSESYFTERNSALNYNEDVRITGRVCEVISHDTNHSLVLENLVINDDSVSGKLSVRLNEDDVFTDYVRVGDKVTFVSRPIVNKIDPLNFSFTDIKYYAYSSLDALTVKPGTLDFREQILGSLRATYNNWLGEYGDLAYGIITGDKNGITNGFRSAYTVSGLSHILAVSGLHIGFLMSMIVFLLRLLKINKKVQPWICAIILLAYNFLVGFSFSVIRASIMFIVSFIASVKGQRNDRLNNLALAVSIILCIFPYALFDVGFIMSVGCMFAIIVFSQSLTDLMLRITKNHFSKVVSALSVSVCAQLGVFPATCLYFSSFSPYAVLVNVLAMPFLNLLYIYVLVFGILAALLPFMGYVLSLAKYLFMVIDAVNGFVGSLPFSEITIYGAVGILLLYIFYFISGRFVMLPKKFIAIILCAVFTVGIVLADNLRFNGDTHVVYADARYDVTTLVKTGDTYVIVGDLTKYCKIESCVEDARAHKIDSIYVTYLTQNNLSFIIRLADKYNVNAVYVRAETETSLVESLFLNNVNVKLASSQNVLYEIEENGDFIGYKYKGVLLTSYKTDLDSVSKQYLSTYDVVRAYSYEEIEGVNFALNFTYQPKENAVGANGDTVLLDCATLAQKRF